MWKDAIVEDLHRLREKIMKEFDNDLGALVAFLQKKEKQHASRLVNPGGRKRKKAA